MWALIREADFELRNSPDSVIRDDFDYYFGRIRKAVGLALEELARPARECVEQERRAG